jgi:hypothetical protein
MFKTLQYYMIAVFGVTAIISKPGRSFPHWLASIVVSSSFRCVLHLSLCGTVVQVCAPHAQPMCEQTDLISAVSALLSDDTESLES